jgi:hypothetical protein
MSGPPLTFPSDYNIEAGLAEACAGKPLRSIAQVMGCTIRHLQRLLTRDTEFNQAMLRARMSGNQIIADEILTLADDHVEADPQWLRVKADNMKWYLKVMQPAIFGDKIQMQVEHVDLKGALIEARTRVITLVNTVQAVPQAARSFTSTQAVLTTNKPDII